MSEDFLGTLMGNPARARLLRIFIFDQASAFSLGQAAKRAGTSQRIATREIRALEKLGIIRKGRSVPAPKSAWKVTKKKKVKKTEPTWTANPTAKNFNAISKLVHEVSPVRYTNVLEALRKAGKITEVVLSGQFVGDPTRPADLLVAGDSFSEKRLEKAVKSLEPVFGWEIRYAAFTTPEFRYRLTVQDRLIRDTLDYPHLVLTDKQQLLG